MNTTMQDQSGSVDIKPEKLYTQNEVDDLHKNWSEDHQKEKEDKEKVEETQTKEDKAKVENEDIKADDEEARLNKRKVARLVKRSNRILVSISSHALPIDLFPDVVNVEEKRITIINNHLLSSEVHSIDIKNISNVLINNSIIFSELVIISDTYEENEIKVKNLRTDDAVFVRRIIEGLRVFGKEDIETYDYTKEELISKLEELSSTEIVK